MRFSLFFVFMIALVSFACTSPGTTVNIPGSPKGIIVEGLPVAVNLSQNINTNENPSFNSLVSAQRPQPISTNPYEGWQEINVGWFAEGEIVASDGKIVSIVNKEGNSVTYLRSTVIEEAGEYMMTAQINAVNIKSGIGPYQGVKFNIIVLR